MRTKRKNIPGVCEDPCEGIWYWVLLYPDWVLYHAVGKIGHPAFWRKTVAGAISKHYRLSAKDSLALESLYYSMPRGRVALREDGKAYIGHGGDAPDSLGDESIKAVVSAFGLSRLAVLNRVVIEVCLHEKMEKSHMKKLWKLIGEKHAD